MRISVFLKREAGKSSFRSLLQTDLERVGWMGILKRNDPVVQRFRLDFVVCFVMRFREELMNIKNNMYTRDPGPWVR